MRARRLAADRRSAAPVRCAGHLPGPEILTPAQLVGTRAATRRTCWTTTADVLSRPGSGTRAVAIRATMRMVPLTGVLQGTEHEQIFASGPGGRFLTEVARRENPPGTVAGFAPPGEQTAERGAAVAVSMYIYGAACPASAPASAASTTCPSAGPFGSQTVRGRRSLADGAPGRIPRGC